MEIIKWTTGEEYKTSKKNDKPILNSNNEIIHNVLYRSEYTKKKDSEVDNFLKEKKEEILNRNGVIQTYINPFLSKDFNDVIIDQEKFLKPQNSSISNL